MPNPLLDLLTLLFFGPIYFFLISLDRHVFRGGNPFLCKFIPRSIQECTPQRIFDMVMEGERRAQNGEQQQQQQHQLETSVLVSCDVVAGTKAEPNKPVLSATVTFRGGGNKKNETAAMTTTRKVFMKLPTERSWTLGFRVIMSCFQSHRECFFFNEVYPALKRAADKKKLLGQNTSKHFFTLHVSKVVIAAHSRSFDRAAIMTEYIDTQKKYICIPDSDGVTAAAVKTMLDAIVPMHALSWFSLNKSNNAGGADDDESLSVLISSNFRDRVGMAWMNSLVQLYQAQIPPTPVWHKFWSAVLRTMEHVPMTLSHGDFRSGNMLFSRAANISPPVIVADWEALSVTPALFDFTYAVTISLPPAIRKKEEKNLLEHYVASLHAALTRCSNNSGSSRPVVSEKEQLMKEAVKQVRILKVCIRVWSWAISCFGGIGDQQGNTAADMRVWRDRVEHVCEETLRDDETQLAADLGIEATAVREFYQEAKTILLKC